MIKRRWKVGQVFVLLCAIAPASRAEADSRLYRHCHIVGSRGFTKCMTADPWSPEHMELDRREGRLYHEGGPIDAARKAKRWPPLHEPN